MIAEIITIGEEILIGQIVDTNSAWIATELNLCGIRVKKITSVPDSEPEIIKSLDSAAENSSLVIVTGGLGPTRDDITKHTFCRYFNCGLVFNEEVFQDVEQIFKVRGKTVTELNRQQAMVPELCTALRNKTGTAPGMWFDMNDKVFVSLPGVPFEMKYLMQNEVLPRIKSRFNTPHIIHKTLLTQGIGESMLAEKLNEWEVKLPEFLSLAYLPSFSQVRLRLSGFHSNKEFLEKQFKEEFDKLKALTIEYSFGENDESLEMVIGKLLKEKGKTLSLAESCTGGQISSLITKIPGASEYLLGSVISYHNSVKIEVLKVGADLIKQHGAVSEEVVKAMAEGVSQLTGSNFAIAVSGIAGPDGGTIDKPVGTVWIAVKNETSVFTRKFLLGNQRQGVIMSASYTALQMLRKVILNKTDIL